MTPTIETILNILNEMKPPEGSNLATRFEKNSEKISNWAMAVGVLLLGLAVLLLLILISLDVKSHWLVHVVKVATFLSVVAVVTGFFAAFSGLVYGIVTMQKFVHLYFLECVKSDAMHAAALRTFDVADLKTVRQILELHIVRKRNRMSVLAGSPDKLNFLALAALGWAGYMTLSPFFSSLTLDISSPALWGAAGAGMVVLLLAGATAGAFFGNIGVQRLVYQTQLIDIATTTTLQPR